MCVCVCVCVCVLIYITIHPSTVLSVTESYIFIFTVAFPVELRSFLNKMPITYKENSALRCLHLSLSTCKRKG